MAEIERRLAARNAAGGRGYFVIPLAALRQWAELFEAPDAAELAGHFQSPAEH